MVRNTNYAGARIATMRAAAELFGAGSAEARAVQDAWNGVGVDGSDTVPPAPIAPKLKFVGGCFDQVGIEALLWLQAPDPQRQKVTFADTGLPPGLCLNADTGRISGTPTQAGEYTVEMTATDTDGNTSEDALTWYIGES